MFGRETKIESKKDVKTEIEDNRKTFGREIKIESKEDVKTEIEDNRTDEKQNPI